MALYEIKQELIDTDETLAHGKAVGIPDVMESDNLHTNGASECLDDGLGVGEAGIGASTAKDGRDT